MNRFNTLRFRSRSLVALAATAALAFIGLARADKMELPASDGVEAVPNIDLNNDQLAARFLDQATAGATPEEVASLSKALSAHPNTAFADWINDQFSKPIQPEDLSLTIFRDNNDTPNPDATMASTATASGAPMTTVATANGAPSTGATTNAAPANGTAPMVADTKKKHADYGLAQGLRGSLMISDNNNELRRMVAYALSQIFVLGDEADSPLNFNSEGMCDYYDLLYKDAFTDFNTILTDVTYHPAMSDYLTSEGNAKAGFYNKNSRPDENYAREVMQLFTIGLVELKEDGSIITDAEGHGIPTYSQPEVTEVARVFTGLKYPVGIIYYRRKGPDGQITLMPQKRGVRWGKDTIEENRHDTGEKAFLGTTLPAGQDTAKDIGDFLQILCHHQNAAPFFAKGMIQHLVTSNPSPIYIKHVADAFKSSNGDMKTVITAILLDDEARFPANAKVPVYGKLREPWLRLTELARGFHAAPADTQPFFNVTERTAARTLGQYPLSAPSVFNFYLPNYQPPGPISDHNANASDGTTLLSAPEFQIVNSNTALLTPNYLMDLIRTEPTQKSRPNSGMMGLDLTPQISLAGDPAALVDNISTLLTGGMMSDRTRGIITDAVNRITPANDPAVLKERARMAIYLTMISPDYAVQK